MSNEVLIEVNASNAAAKAVFADTEAAGKTLGGKPITVPVKAQLAFDQANGVGALGKEIEKGPPVKVPVTANNPINEAWAAQVKASVKTLSKDALDIPVDADLAPFQEQLEAVLAELSTTSKLNVPVEAGDGMIFRAQVEELVAQVEASTKAVIDLEVNESGLTELQTRTVASSQATLELVAAEQKLNSVMASGNDEAVAKARQQVVAATVAEREATEELAAAQEAAAAEAGTLAEEEEVAASASRGLGSAMGPLFLLMTVGQIAMMAFGSASDDTGGKAQDASQQIIALGQSAGQTAQNLIGGNQALQAMASSLTVAGTSATSFSSAYSGSVKDAQTYTDSLVGKQKTLGDTIANTGGQLAAFDGRPLKDFADNIKAADISQLPQGLQQQVAQYQALGRVLPQAQDALAGLIAAEAQQKATLDSVGFSMNSAQQATNDYGLGIQNAAKAIMDATAGATYLEDSTDKASIAAGQGVQSWHQLQAAVVSAGAAHDQAAAAVTNAKHGVETASQAVAQAEHGEEEAAQGVANARHSEEQAILATKQAQQGYTEAVYEERQAQLAVTAARATAEQQLISLKLQSDSAATSVNSARESLFNATQEASKYGVNPGNARQIADEPINASNEKEVAAANALVQAQEQLASSQNSSTQAQADLNTARKEGVDNNPAVLGAEHALSQAKSGVTQAAQGVANAEYAQQQATRAVSDAQYAQRQASEQVTNAEWGLRQASQGVATAEAAEKTASGQLADAQDATSRSVDANTLSGARNRQQIEGIYQAYLQSNANAPLSAKLTEAIGDKMGFTADKIHDVIGRLDGLDGTTAHFSMIATPSMNVTAMAQAAQNLGFSWAQISAALPSHDASKTKATGGPTGGLTWVGEQGPELVQLAAGSNVIPSSNSMQRVLMGEVSAPRRANGGPVSLSPAEALGFNVPIAAQFGAADAIGQAIHVLGGPPMKLPPATAIDFGAIAAATGLGGSHVSGNRASNKAIMQAVFSQYGWGSGAAWAAQDYLEMREAGYNNLAQNPTSTAFGEGQFLNSTWGAYGFQKTADPKIQSEAMLAYEIARYHGPIGAAQHEREVNWYGAGGPAGGLIGVGEHGPELVRVPGGSSVIPHANTALAAQSGPVEVKVTIDFGTNSDGAFAAAFKQMVRTGQITMTANNTRVAVG